MDRISAISVISISMSLSHYLKQSAQFWVRKLSMYFSDQEGLIITVWYHQSRTFTEFTLRLTTFSHFPELDIGGCGVVTVMIH